MELMAEALGLGVLYSGLFSMAANRLHPLHKLLGLKPGNRVAMTMVQDYSAVTYYRTAPKEAAIVKRL